VIAHVGPIPLEELLPWASGPGAGLLMARGWIMFHMRRRRDRDE
jgi:hypothetical protein